MTSRERVVRTFNLEIPDRVPIDYAANPGIDAKLKMQFGLAATDDEGLRQRLGVDFRYANPPYIGPKRHPDIPERGIKCDPWGIRRRWVEHDTGGYWDYADFPLKEADLEAVAAWPLPSPDDFDYAAIPALCERYREFAIGLGSAGVADVMNSNGMLRSMEQTYLDLALDDPAGLLLAKRRTDIQFEWMSRALDTARGRIDFLYIGEDLGTQRGPLISMETYRKHLKPIHQRFINLARAHRIPIMVHTCGSSSWAYDEFIDMGVRVVDTLQPEAAAMAPGTLKSRFGGRLAFHGCISTAGPVAFGSAPEAERACREILDIMKPGGGYAFAPTHCLQDNTPVENALAMYRTALEYGRY